MGVKESQPGTEAGTVAPCFPQVDDGRYVEAAGLLPLLLGPDASRWEEWFFVFLDRGQLHALAPLLPADPEGLRLSATVYALCLTYLLRTDPEGGLLPM